MLALVVAIVLAWRYGGGFTNADGDELTVRVWNPLGPPPLAEGAVPGRCAVVVGATGPTACAAGAN